MTCTNQQVKILMKKQAIHTQEVAAAKAGMHVQTARKYLRPRCLPSELKKPHPWRTKMDEFAGVWAEVEAFLISAPGLQAKTVFEHLQKKHPGRFKNGQLRTLQRRFQSWRAVNGKEQKVIFRQIHIPGVQSQSDYTDMNALQITIGGEHFKHLLFHFMLTYSRWEDVSICYEESFASLACGYEKAAWRLGAVAPEHRTDNLSAATKKAGGSREFTIRWQKLMEHYGVKPSRNNPGESNENGSIEKSHDLFKTAVDQQLMLRGSRDFISIVAYEEFLEKVLTSRNCVRKDALAEEIDKLRDLPGDKWDACKIVPVRVSPSSVINVENVTYSVPSRLIGYSLTAHIYYDKIRLFYGQKCLQEMPKSKEKLAIDYRHIVDGLMRKPGAFANYQYKEALFPEVCFRQAYDQLIKHSPACGHKHYLSILQLAKMHGEQQVVTALQVLQANGVIPLPDSVKKLLDIPMVIPKVEVPTPSLLLYDQLLQHTEVLQ
jgi:transposase